MLPLQGLRLKRHTNFGLDLQSTQLDPTLWDDPSEFQPFRFSEAKAGPGEEHSKYFFTSTNVRGGMHFGHGRHSCPGRNFGTMLIKMLLTHLFHEFEVQFAEPWDKGGFPPPMKLGGVQESMPNMAVELMVKKRVV